MTDTNNRIKFNKRHVQDAVNTLAIELHKTLERFDPAEDPKWSDLNEFQRDMYEAVIRHLLMSKRELFYQPLSPATT